MSAKKKLFADVQVGDAIWSDDHVGPKRWIVIERRKSVFVAERKGRIFGLRETWRYDGSPSTAICNATPETPEQRDAFLRAEEEKEQRAKLAAEARHAELITLNALSSMHRGFVSYPGDTCTLPLAKAQALARFIESLVREGE